MADINTLKKGLIVTAFWEARPDEVDALVGIIKKFLPQAQAEPGVLAFQIHQSLTEPTKFFFYEVFKDEAAFAEHARPPHFKTPDPRAGGAAARQARADAAQVRLASSSSAQAKDLTPVAQHATGVGVKVLRYAQDDKK